MTGAKLNDVVLAGVAGAMRRLSALVDEEPASLRVMVPVNVRGSGDGAAEETESRLASSSCRPTRPTRRRGSNSSANRRAT